MVLTRTYLISAAQENESRRSSGPRLCCDLPADVRVLDQGEDANHVDVVVDQGELVAAAVLVPARLKSPSAHITSLIRVVEQIQRVKIDPCFMVSELGLERTVQSAHHWVVSDCD